MRVLRWLRQRFQIRERSGAAAMRWAADYYDGGRRAVAAKVGTIVMDQLGVDIRTVTPAMRFVEDLHKRNLESVELLLAVEDAFGIEITEEDAERVSSVGSLIEYVHERIREISDTPL